MVNGFLAHSDTSGPEAAPLATIGSGRWLCGPHAYVHFGCDAWPSLGAAASARCRRRLPTKAPWTAGASKHTAHLCLPSVRLPAGPLGTDPVSTLAAFACDLAGLKACCGICCPVPKLHQGVVTLCQRRVTLRLLPNSRLINTKGASSVVQGAMQNLCHPFMTLRASPPHSFVAEHRVVMWGAMIAITPFCCHLRSPGS